MTFVQSLAVLFAVFAHFGLSAVAADSRLGSLNDPKSVEEHSTIGKRAEPYCQVCSSGTCGSSGCSITKRSLVFNDTYIDTQAQLDKRVFQTLNELSPDEEYFNFFKDQPLEGMISLTPEPSFCVQAEFTTMELENGRFRIGSGNSAIYGCTVLAIVSPRAVYMCHFWESLHYLPESLGFGHILSLVEHGSGIAAAGPALNPGLFLGQNHVPEAFILTPRNRYTNLDPDSQQYPSQYAELRELVRKLLPGVSIVTLNYNTYVHEHRKGIPISESGLIQNRAFFEYDRNAYNTGTADFRLFLDYVSKSGREIGWRVAPNT